MADGEDIGYWTLPVILSFEGIDKQVNRSLGGVLGKAGVRGGKEYGKGLADGAKVAEAEVKKLSGSYEKMYNKAADQADKLKVAKAGIEELDKKGITSGQRYERLIAAQAKAQRDHNAAVREAKDVYADLQKAQQRAADEAKNSGTRSGAGFLSGLRTATAGAASAGGGAASSFAEGFAGSSALLRLGSVGGPVGIAVAAAGVVLGGLLWKNVMAGVDQEPARDLIQAKLGLDEGSMAKVAGAAGRAYADNFGTSLEDNMKAAQLAIQGGLVGANDPALQGVTEKLQAISQLVDGDLAQTTKSASILLKNGLAGSAEEAFDIIAKGYQVTGDLGGDWLDTLGEYSNGWKNAGLTAQQALALIKQAQDNGVDVTDRSADALREFGRRIAEEGPKMVQVIDAIGLNGQAMYEKFKAGGPAAFEAFDAVFDKIRSLQNPVERNQAAMALLGDTAGDFIDAFAKWDPSAAVDSLGDIKGAAEDAAHTLGDNTAGSIESARRSLDIALKDTQRGLAQAYGPALAEVADWIKDHQDEIKGFFVGVGDVAIDMSKIVVYAFGTLVGALGDIGGAFGDAFGLILDGAALMEDAFGDPAVAASLREDAQAAYGFGDGLKGMRDRINNDVLPSMDEWKNKLHDTATETDTASDNTGELGKSIKGVGDATRGLPSTVPPWYQQLLDGSGGAAPSNPLLGPLGGVPAPSGGGGPLLGPGGIPLLPTGGGGSGVGINLQIAADNAAAAAGDASLWDKVAKAESSGNWQDNNSGGHSTSSGAPRGGLQITDGTWKAFGGTDFAPTANLASKDQQIAVANRIAFSGYKGTKPQGLSAWETITNGSVPGVTASTPQPAVSAAAAPPISAGAVDVRGAHTQIADVAAAAEAMFPGLQVTAGRDDHSKDGGYHPRGEAVDIGGDPASMNALSNYLTQNFAPYLAELIHEGSGVTQNVKDGKLTPAIDMPGSIYSTAQAGNHDDHVHIAIKDDMAAAFQQALGLGPSGVSGLATAGPQSASLVSAFGNQYKPGIGTPGYNEYGEPGYYETDPQRIQQAQRGIEDSAQRISDADQAVTDSQSALNDSIKERDRIAKLSAVERITQGVDLDKANAEVERAQKQADRAVTEARRSKEDAQWAQKDLDEAQQGQFTKAGAASKQKSGKGGFDQFGGLGSIFGGALKETFGLDGSFFPDISNLMPMQMLNAGLNAFAGPLQGLVDGQLGIQQPGWQPGMPVNGVQNDTGIGTANSPFGMPDVAVPPVPPGDQHIGPGGPGAPGPVQNVTIDQSINGSQFGWGSDDIAKQRTQGMQRAIPRIPAMG